MTEPENFLPAPEIRGFISHYGVLEIPETAVEPYFSPPLGLSGFIIQSITGCTVDAHIQGRIFFKDAAVATGQVTTPVYGQIEGRAKSLLVFFQPLGMHQLFNTDMARLTNKAIPLTEFFGAGTATDLLDKLRRNQNSKHQIAVLDEFFMNLSPVKTNSEKLIRVLDYIHDKKGDVSVHEIQEYGHYHRRTLERQFKEMIGLTPKVYAQIYRFKCLINLLHTTPGISWTELADHAGYYDQSHMSRYVKEYLKVSPNDMVQLDMDFINYLLSR